MKYSGYLEIKIKHYGHPINQWGYEIVDNEQGKNKIVASNKFCGDVWTNCRYAFKEAEEKLLELIKEE